MLRQNKLAIVSHCILNQNTVVQPLARSGGSFQQLVTVLALAGLGIYQLPCPEFIHSGMTRQPQTYEEYNTPAYEAVCRQAADRALQDLTRFQAAGCDVSLLLGIRRSPTCSLAGRTGHLFRLLLPELITLFPAMLIMDVPPDYLEGQSHEFESVLRKALQS